MTDHQFAIYKSGGLVYTTIRCEQANRIEALSDSEVSTAWASK